MKKDEDQVTGIQSKTKKMEICKIWPVRLTWFWSGQNKTEGD